MSSSRSFFMSSIASKVVMAITGALLFLFVISHMIGNWQIFLGQKVLNDYAEFLQGLGGGLWAMRLGLLAIFVIHIAVSIALTLENWKARPVPYKFSDTVKATLASRTMIYTGALVLAFVIFHLFHFTFGKVQPEYFHMMDPQGRPDVYSMAIHGFQDVTYSTLYIVMLLVLGMHLSHAIASCFETLGFNHAKYEPYISKLSRLIGWGIAAGYIIIPISVLAGLVKLPGGGN